MSFSTFTPRTNTAGSAFAFSSPIPKPTPMAYPAFGSAPRPERSVFASSRCPRPARPIHLAPAYAGHLARPIKTNFEFSFAPLPPPAPTPLQTANPASPEQTPAPAPTPMPMPSPRPTSARADPDYTALVIFLLGLLLAATAGLTYNELYVADSYISLTAMAGWALEQYTAHCDYFPAPLVILFMAGCLYLILTIAFAGTVSGIAIFIAMTGDPRIRRENPLEPVGTLILLLFGIFFYFSF